jgi:hypothetical protein
MKFTESARTFTGRNTMRYIMDAEMGDIHRMGRVHVHVE